MHTAVWQSGYAAACKAVYAGSIPASASKDKPTQNAQVAKQVDARDLKSLGGNTMPVRFRPWAPHIKFEALSHFRGALSQAHSTLILIL